MVTGWINFCGRFHRSELINLLDRLNRHLLRSEVSDFPQATVNWRPSLGLTEKGPLVGVLALQGDVCEHPGWRLRGLAASTASPDQVKILTYDGCAALQGSLVGPPRAVPGGLRDR